MSTNMYAIAVATADLDGREHDIRYWGKGTQTFLWFHENTAEEYLSNLPDEFFTGKIGGPRHQVLDAWVTLIEAKDRHRFGHQGGVFFPWFSEWTYPDEGYDTEPTYAEEEQNND